MGLDATRFAVNMAKPGIKIEEIVEKTLSLVDKKGYGKYVSSFMGHGIGLETVEDPYIVRGVDMELKENMVLNIEPGITITDFAGVRIEQEVIVKDEPEVITKTEDKLW
ncbi:MAG TPA: M24 family metallopeptidase [Thermoplasmatales archaeon]|nr:M24 family metallopeptidase [Thermoplasmatales archaeon]